jgi:hypothetical protein
MDGAGRGLPPYYAETRLDPLRKVSSRPMLPALIALNPRATNKDSIKDLFLLVNRIAKA